MMKNDLDEYSVELKISLDVKSHRVPLWAVRMLVDAFQFEVNKFNNETLTSDRMNITGVNTKCEKYEPECEMEDAEEYRPYDEK